MPDKYDPKQTLRSPYGRPAEPRPAPAPKEDPLAELARMVHGRANLEPQPLTRAPEEPAQPADLESELLNDLQASFAAVREAAAQVSARRPEPAPPAQVAAPRSQPAVPSAPLSLSPEPPRARPAPPAEVEYPSIFAPRTQAQPTPPRPEGRADAHPEIRPEFRLEPLDESRLVPIPSAPVIQPQVPPGYAERQAERQAAAAASEASPRAFERNQRDMTPAEPDPEEDDFTAFQLRPSTPATAQTHPPAPPPTPSRWEKPQPIEAAPVPVSRFAPPAAGVAAEETFETEEEFDPFSEAGLFPVTETSDDEFEAGEFGLPPDYPDDEEAFAGPEETQPARRRPKAAPPRGMLIAAAVVAIALVGGISVAMFRTGQNSTGAPPTILADDAPTKITPDDSQAQASNDAASQNKIIYDRVNSAEANNNTTLLTPDNAPLRTAPAPDTGNAISRVILPGGPGYDSATGSPAPASTDASDATAPSAPPGDDGDDSLGPRKVRTVVVKPDGTILSSSATNAPDTGGGSPAAAPVTTTSAAAPLTPPVAAAPASPAPATDDTAAIAGTGDNALTITTDPDATSAPTIPPTPAPATAAAAPAVPQARPAAKPAPATVARNDANDPIDLTPGGTPATTALGQGFFVQVSSQHTEDAARATYKDLQARYPTILGKYGVDLQQADVPSRGTFYRVRVGPFAAADAQRLCDDLKSAGGDCVLARH